MRSIYVLGASGLAKEVAQLIGQINAVTPTWKFGGYIDVDRGQSAKLPWGEVVGDDDWLMSRSTPVDVAIGVGSPNLRRKISEKFRSLPGFEFPNLIHPSTFVDTDVVSMGVGNAIARGCVFTCDIAMGDFNFFNLNVTIGHDCKIGSCNVINPGCNVSGGVEMGDSILVGTGASIIEQKKIASETTIGAGAVVVRDIVEPGIWAGVPAKVLTKSA